MASGLLDRTTYFNLFSKLCGFATTTRIQWCINSLSMPKLKKGDRFGDIFQRAMCFSFRRPQYFFKIWRKFHDKSLALLFMALSSNFFSVVHFLPIGHRDNTEHYFGGWRAAKPQVAVAVSWNTASSRRVFHPMTPGRWQLPLCGIISNSQKNRVGHI